MSDAILIESVDIYLYLRQKSLKITLENRFKLIRFFLNIENLEWSAYILRDLFSNQI